MQGGRGSSASAPGKLILFGEHAVVYGKKGIASSVNLRTRVTLVEVDGGCFVLDRPAPFQKVSVPFSLLAGIARTILPTKERDTEAYLKQVVDVLPAPELHLNIKTAFQEYEGSLPNLEDDLGCLSAISLFCILLSCEDDLKPASGWRMKVTSDLPMGAGLGSSAAYHVSMAASFIKCSPYLPVGVPLSEERWKFWTNELAFALEKIVHGPSASGIDNMVSTYGGMLVYHQKTPSFRKGLSRLDVLITNTKVPRNTKNLIATVKENLDKVGIHSIVSESLLIGEYDSILDR